MNDENEQIRFESLRLALDFAHVKGKDECGNADSLVENAKKFEKFLKGE